MPTWQKGGKIPPSPSANGRAGTVRYLLDTDICIYLMRESSTSVTRHFTELRVGDVSMSTVTLAELERGIGADPGLARHRRHQLDRLLAFIPAEPFDAAAARSYGELRARSVGLGRNRFDTLIAAHALSRGLTLVTTTRATSPASRGWPWRTGLTKPGRVEVGRPVT